MNAVRFIFIILAIAISYVAMARLGLIYALNPGFATAFFPASGLSVAALIIFGHMAWPGIFIGSLVVNLITSLPLMLSSSVFVSAGIAIGSTLQGLAIAYFLKKVIAFNHLLSIHRNVIIFLIATIPMCLISSVLGTTILYFSDVITQDYFLANWVTWWIGDIMGIWIFTPLVLSWSYFTKKDLDKPLEALLLVIVVLIIGIICFGGWLKNEYPLEYLLIPCLLWGIFRFKSYMVTFLLALVSFIASWGTSNGLGPFAQSTLNESLILLQLYIGVISVMTLLLTSILCELRRNSVALEELNQKLIEQNLTLQEKNHRSHTKS